MTLGAGGARRRRPSQSRHRDFAFDAPLDLRSLSDSRSASARQGDEFVVDGQVTIDEAGLTGDINFDTGLLAAIDAPPTLDLTEERNPLLERVRFNVDVETATPILRRQQPGAGRGHRRPARARHALRARPVGTADGARRRRDHAQRAPLRGGARRHHVHRRAPHRPVVRSAAEHERPATTTSPSPSPATPGDTETTLTSDPSLPEPDIMALLVTGRTLDEMRGEEYDVAREQVLSYSPGASARRSAAASSGPPASARCASSRT